jgi:hypothetical protein
LHVKTSPPHPPDALTDPVSTHADPAPQDALVVHVEGTHVPTTDPHWHTNPAPQSASFTHP